MNRNDPSCYCVPLETKASTALANLVGIFALGVLALVPWAMQQ